MAVAFVQQIGVDNTYASIGGTTYTLSCPTATTAGNAIVFCIFWKETGALTLSSVVDNKGGTYVDCGAGKTARPSTGFVQILGAKNVASGGSRTITVTFSGTGAATIASIALEYSGCDTTTLFDTISASGTATSGTTVTATANPTVTSGAFFTYAVNNVGGTATINNSFNERYDDSGGGWENADKVFTSAPGATSPTVTFSSSFTQGVLLMAVLAAVAAGDTLMAQACL